MLEIQKFLAKGGNLDQLGIKRVDHPDQPLMILNYDQLESPKGDRIARECRGLVLNSKTYELVARSFPRFFNWGEMANEMPDFNWGDFVSQSKEDGSLVLFYNFEGNWYINTRESFGTDLMQFQDFTWRKAILEAMKLKSVRGLDAVLDPSLTYVCEFCSPYNKVVRRYKDSRLYLLTAFSGEKELGWKDALALKAPFITTQSFPFKSLKEIEAFIKECEVEDPTFEGLVIRDNGNNRWKIKSSTYLGLHRIKGDNGLFNPKHLLPFALQNNGDELLTYFPEATDEFNKLNNWLQFQYDFLLKLWKSNWNIGSQKDFALNIVGSTPFTPILFNLRKKLGKQQTQEALREEWLRSQDFIEKVVCGKLYQMS